MPEKPPGRSHRWESVLLKTIASRFKKGSGTIPFLDSPPGAPAQKRRYTMIPVASLLPILPLFVARCLIMILPALYEGERIAQWMQIIRVHSFNRY